MYRFGEVPTRLVAELRGENAVWVRVEGAARPLAAEAYRVERWDGEPVAVTGLTPHEAETALLTSAPLDPDQVHYVEADTEAGTVRAMARFDGLWRDVASDVPLGVAPSDCCGGNPDCAIGCASAHDVRLFAPRADSVVVHLYESRTGPEVARHALSPRQGSVWHARVRGDLPGTWYDFSVYGPGGPGSAFTNQTGETVSDPYALVSDDSWGRARIWRDDFEPPQPVAGGRPAMEDVVAWEVHLQDATDELPVPEGVGPLEAFAIPGLTNSRGEPVGIDYVERLGVNVVHLMPVQEFLHYPDDAWQAAFADDPFMQEQGIAKENYQWGYRTTHALAIESRFRSEGDEPGHERERLRDLVDAFHERGIAVVVDVVFNHTGENMEGVEQLLTFNGIDKWYYYRLDDDGNHIGAFGNEVKSENRPFVQRWLLDQLRQLVEVFGIDGFRIDLAGQTDEQTLRWLQAELGEDVLIYGEPWIGSNDPDYEANPSWDWYKADSPITFFQDEARNAFKGSPLDDPTPAPSSRGFAGGDPEAREAALVGVANAYPEEPTPNAGINYLDIHDNWALADRFASCQTGDCAWDGREGVRAAEMRIAATLLLTSLGPVVMHGGTEIARSKGLASLPGEIDGEWERTEMAVAPIYIKGRGDTYNLRAANAFLWETVGNREGPVDHAEMFDWWEGLIALRLSEAGEVFRVGEAVPEGWVRPFYGEDGRVLAYLVGGRVLVGINGGDQRVQIEVDAPDGSWRTVARSTAEDAIVALDGEVPDTVSVVGGSPTSVVVEPKGVVVMVRE
ncbi:hypothetical protein BSZ37_14730 [Rubrivirga marina]|uniref:Glycosyl hydrolase family 13 catalytic domain-containing protein n=1 Tax=Rubrivirga marina TaxID=1196024 RepID=A0A271J5I4_9BACT|nr:hypothetical protein BSZ37_14730 [Rubrivirga marina]